MPVLLMIVCINFVGVGALIPILPYTILETMGQPASVMTLLLASFALAMFVANPILGRLSDYFGRRLYCFFRWVWRRWRICGLPCRMISPICSWLGLWRGSDQAIQALFRR